MLIPRPRLIATLFPKLALASEADVAVTAITTERNIAILALLTGINASLAIRERLDKMQEDRKKGKPMLKLLNYD